MSRKGNYHDNAIAESFFSLLKTERIKRKIYKTRDEARAEIFNYIAPQEGMGPTTAYLRWNMKNGITKKYQGSRILGACHINDLEDTKMKVNHPQTSDICERLHKTILQDFYQVAFKKKVYETIDQLQNDLDEWLDYYNNEPTHQGKICSERTPIEILLDGKQIWQE